MIAFRLALAEARSHWLRLSIAVLTVGGAISLVVWTVGTLATARAQHHDVIRKIVGDYDAWIVPDAPDPAAGGKGGHFGIQSAPAAKQRVWEIKQDVVEAVGSDTSVARLDAYRVALVQIDYNPGGQRIAGPRPRGALAGTDALACPYGADVLEGAWLPGGASTGEVPIVVSAGLFFRSPPAIGGVVTLLSANGPVKARVIGRMRQQSLGRGIGRVAMPTMFVSVADYERFFRETTAKESFDVVCLKLAEGRSVARFHADWDARLKNHAFPCRVEDPGILLERMNDQAASRMLHSAPVILGLAVTATICIIITTLSIGLRQRLMTLAMLRALGGDRRLVFLLILIEGIVVAAFGWMIGVLGGWGGLAIMTAMSPEAYPKGAVLGGSSLLAALICAVLGVAGAALVPALQAARMRPMDVLQDIYAERRTVSAARTVIGILLLLPAPILSLNLPVPVDLRCRLLLWLALPALFAGCVLVAPLLVVITEKLFGGLLCRFAGMHPRLIASPLKQQMGRVVGTAITISVALGLYIAIETWGRSMTKPFLPSSGLPDVIISFLPGGVPVATVSNVLQAAGIRKGEAFALEAKQYVLDDITLERLRQKEGFQLQQNNVLILGIDAEKAFGGKSPMFDLRFVSGNAEDALKRLQSGGACVVPAMFIDQSGFKLGDKVGFRVESRSDDETAGTVGERVVMLEIAGVIDLNWHLVTARAGLRGQDGAPFGTLSPVFISYEQARELSGNNDTARFVWANLDDDLRKLQVEEAVAGLESSLADTVRLNRARPGSAATDPAPAGRPQRRGGRGAFIQVSHRDFVYSGTEKHADDLVSAMSRIPFWALVILSLSIVNAVAASVQARRIEIGRMRAIGLSRSQLLRLVCIEGVLIGIVAALLSLLFGIEAGWCFTGYTRGTMSFGGLPVSFSLPYVQLIQANALALALSLVAALFPAILISREEPARLVQTSRDV